MANGQITISVDKAQLLTTLELNRRDHGTAYEKAKGGYIKVTSAQLKDYLTQLAEGELLIQRFIPAPPEDHTDDYDDVIEMMKWAQGASIELTQQQFKQYVQDDWGWKEAWVTSNTAYLQA